MSRDNEKLTEGELRQFTGSEHWYRHALMRSILYTDGAKLGPTGCSMKSPSRSVAKRR
jgi:hypothetical protein